MEFKLTTSREIFSFERSLNLGLDYYCMFGLTHLEVHNSILNITEETNKLEIYTQPLDDEFSYNQLKDNVAELLGLSDISAEVLQNEILGTEVIETYRKLSIEKSRTDGYHILLLRYVHSLFRNFESYLRILTGLNENDIQLKYNSNFITCKISPGVYAFLDISEVLSSDFQNEFEIRGRLRPNQKYDGSDSIIIESDNVILINKLIVDTQIQPLRFDKNSFFNIVLSFPPYWDYKIMIVSTLVREREILLQ